MRTSSIIILIILFSSTAKAELTTRIGLGYDNITQRYRLIEADTTEIDNELKLFLYNSLDINDDNNTYNIELNGYAGTEATHLSLQGEARLGKSIRLYEKLYGKAHYEKRNKDYVKSYLKGSWKHSLTNSWTTELSGYLTSRFYTGASPPGNDYHMLHLEGELRNYLFFDRDISLSVQTTGYIVPDSVDLCYSEAGTELLFEKQLLSGYRLSGEDELIYKDYKGEINPSSWKNTVSLEVEYSPNFNISLPARFDYTVLKTEYENFVWFDYRDIKGGAGISYITEKYSVGAVPSFEHHSADTLYDGENWTDVRCDITGTISSPQWLWLDATVSPGYRFFRKLGEFSIYSDYFFTELSLLGSIRFSERCKLDAIFSYSPEWHKTTEDNFISTYLSLKVLYEF
ncbi:hypothetical protein J7K18_03740 [bacterium]|nr:hypothetical protein [bacterium]